jgi:hypothetical protein
MKSPQQRAADTRRGEKMAYKRYLEVEVPVLMMIDVLLNRLCTNTEVRVVWQGALRRTLKHGATGGRLVRTMNGGRTWTVLADGYKQPQRYHPSYWRLVR